jgi:transposase-like protein
MPKMKNEEKIEKVKSYYASGKSLASIGKLFKVDGTTVQRWMKKHGIQRRRQGSPGGLSKTTLKNISKVRAMRRDGMTLKSIGDKLGFTRQYAEQLLNLKDCSQPWAKCSV